MLPHAIIYPSEKKFYIKPYISELSLDNLLIRLSVVPVCMHVCLCMCVYLEMSWTLSEIIDKRGGEGLEMAVIGAFLFFVYL